MRFTVVINFLALGILASSSSRALSPASSTQPLPTSRPKPGNIVLPAVRHRGIFPAIPFAIWFYLAIEELPLAAEESHDPKRDIPRATLWGMHHPASSPGPDLFLNTGVDGGAKRSAASATPLFDGFKAVFGDNTGAALLGLLGLIGLIASFFTIIYAYGRNTYSLSRAGYFPHFLSITHPHPEDSAYRPDRRRRRRACARVPDLPARQREPGRRARSCGALLYMAVFGAVISYAMQCVSFILLRRRLPNIERPYRSPVGVVGRGHCRRHRA